MRTSIATRLTLAFMILTAAVGAIAVLALLSFPRLIRTVQGFQDMTLRELAIFEDVRVLIADAVSQDHAYILSSGDDAYDEAFDADMEEIDRLLENYDLLHRDAETTPAMVDALAALRAAVEHLTSAHDAVEELILQHRLQDAQHMSAREGRGAAQAALEAVRGLVQAERRDTRRAITTVAADADRLHRIMLSVALLAAVAGGAVALSTVRSIIIPVRRLVDVTRRVDRGTLDVQVGLAGGDEIGELGQSFDRMIDRLGAAFAEQERFLADISHELRTPITIVRGHLEMLQRGERAPEQIGRALAISLDELDRMGRLVNDLLLLARAVRPGFLSPRPLDLPALLDEVFQKAQAIAPRPWRRDPAPQITIVADRDRLTQAMLNLLHNAVAHTQPDQPITLSASATHDWVEIAVTDGGAGIAAELLPHLFERFRTGSSGRTGLGLSIVQVIARAHGGDVAVRSEPGRGSTFTIRLPRNPGMPHTVATPP